MPFVDQILRCADCGSRFVFTADEQEFFALKGFTNLPRHCKRCRSKRNAGSPRFRQAESKVICATCGKETTVPFIPTRNRPVFCRVCFDEKNKPGPSSREVQFVKSA
jgi:CxxC-x17-CxxC domain-containing protein